MFFFSLRKKELKIVKLLNKKRELSTYFNEIRLYCGILYRS